MKECKINVEDIYNLLLSLFLSNFQRVGVYLRYFHISLKVGIEHLFFNSKLFYLNVGKVYAHNEKMTISFSKGF